jgi:hypothetical protein
MSTKIKIMTRKNQRKSPNLKIMQALCKKKKIKKENSILISSDTHYSRGMELLALTCKTSHNINNQRLDQ